MNHHLTATGNMGQVFRKAYPLLNLTRMGGVPEEGIAVAGPAARRSICSATTYPGRPRGGGPDRRLLQRGLRLLRFQPGLPEPSSASRSAAVAGWGPHLLRPGGSPEDVLSDRERCQNRSPAYQARSASARSALRALVQHASDLDPRSQQVGFCRSDPRPGAHHEPRYQRQSGYALGKVTGRLAEMLK